MPAHRVRPARSPDRPPLHPTTLPGTGPHPTEPSGRSAPVASARSPNEPIGGRKNTNRETDATGHTANTPSVSRSTDFPPRKRPCNRRGRQKRTLPPRPNCPPIRRKRPKTDRTATSGCTASPRRPPGPPLFLPENGDAANVDDKNARPLAQIVRRSEGSAPKRSGPVRAHAPQMPPPGLPPQRFFLPRRREQNTMRTEESERQAKGKRRKRHKRQEGERETGRQETEKTRKTDSPENGFGPAATVCGRAESFEDRRSGQPEPSRFRALSIGNNRLCKVLRR